MGNTHRTVFVLASETGLLKRPTDFRTRRFEQALAHTIKNQVEAAYPLMWLGHPDPATSLLEQVRHDPDGDVLSGLMTEWHAVFGSTPTTVRKAVEAALRNHTNLLDAMREFNVEERGEINRSKLGWLLKRYANRIVSGFEFQQCEADGRTACPVPSGGSMRLTQLESLAGPIGTSIAKTGASPHTARR